MLQDKQVYRTSSRDEIIDLCKDFTEAVQHMFVSGEKRSPIIKIEGDVGSGKSLIADAMKAYWFGMAVEAATWKGTQHTNGYIKGQQATVTFMNARHRLFQSTFDETLTNRTHNGPIFISNDPLIRSFSFLPFILKMPQPDATITVKFAEGEPRPVQFGPIKYGGTKEIGNRVITFEKH